MPPERIASALAAYPTAGTLRVHPAPERLHPPEPERPGLNRFDDPDGLVAVRYTATRLTGCLRETMARLRPSSTAESVLNAIDGIEADDVDWPADDTTGVGDWLARQRVGTVRVIVAGSFIDIEQDPVLVDLDKHPRVRVALEALDPSARLDVAYLRLGGRLGRPISQAVGVAVREWLPDALGIAYRSRLATDEPCWAIWHNTPVDITSVPLDPANTEHRGAVRQVATAYEIRLPEDWL